MYVPYHKDNISMAGPRGFVKIVRLYLLTTDIWICWFHRFAFVKPSYLHLQTSDINSSFGAALDFSKKSFVFSKSNHLHFHSGDIHICQSLLFSSLLINQISPVQTIFTQHFLLSD